MAGSSAEMVRVPLDRSTDSSPLITGGKSESMCTDARRWVDVVVGAQESSFLVASIFSEK